VDVVRSGRAVNEPWKFYDLGHGYCAYDFFDQCPHRMACAKCSFYLPKHSSQAQLVEGKSNLVQLRQEKPLSEAEVAAVDDGIDAMENLLGKLADVPTPSGPTPREIRGERNAGAAERDTISESESDETETDYVAPGVANDRRPGVISTRFRSSRSAAAHR
jgi:hypothetical protein